MHGRYSFVLVVIRRGYSDAATVNTEHRTHHKHNDDLHPDHKPDPNLNPHPNTDMLIGYTLPASLIPRKYIFLESPCLFLSIGRGEVTSQSGANNYIDAHNFFAF